MSKKKKNNQNLKRFAVGSSIAAMAGYIVGLLSAPKSGKTTLDDLMGTAEKGKTDLSKQLKNLNEDLSEVITQAKKSSGKMNNKAQKEVKGLVEKSLDTKEKLKEVASAIHDGTAEDEDLKRAIKNANNAVEHLKDFLKK
jgi:gas vesicle protein